MNIALGGERVGSGNKMNLHLHHYERSTHNLSQSFKSSMGVGMLYPFLCIPALRGDKFDINLTAGCRTIPSKGAMFGTYKLQIDLYQCPVRLYTGILHNNPIQIGLQMDKVLFPQMRIYGKGNTNAHWNKIEFSTSSLLHYLGLSGLGRGYSTTYQSRDFNAIPVLAYYDIFKNYYSNKQEKYAYVLAYNAINEDDMFLDSPLHCIWSEDEELDLYKSIYHFSRLESAYVDVPTKYDQYIYSLSNDNESYVLENTRIVIEEKRSDDEQYHSIFSGTMQEADSASILAVSFNASEITFEFSRDIMQTENGRFTLYFTERKGTIDETNIARFDLANIDKMRSELLSHHTLGTPYVVNNFNQLPYSAVAYTAPNELNTHALQGLVLKTYQSDIFNNWLSSEFIDGVNGIANITKVSTEGGGFTIDSLNFAEKMYNLLNRIVVSGGTYEDWQNVVYENTPKRHLESPMYLGGASQEIIFEEIINTADLSSMDGASLGKIGGRGISRHRKGGHVRVKVDEASFIIGIVSITPRVDYSQGNEFYFTDIKSMDDFHKPALDGIGFQDLIGERMAYFDTKCIGSGKIERNIVGKIPAWLEYMTAVDKVHGDFANGDLSYMVLNRDYQYNEDFGIEDATTYVDPAKYNHNFAYDARDAQNFWVQISSSIIARRKMSAKQIPNI